jgi:ankyrin repeat protein
MLRIQDLFNALTGRNINKKDDNGDTRLYLAARAGSIGDVRKLLRAGADPNIANGRGLTPLHQAAYWGETEIVELLLKSGAKADADNGCGWTPMHSAALAGGMQSRADIIARLKKAGARDDAPGDQNGWTPADYMTLWEHNAAAAAKLRDYAALDHARPDGKGGTQKKPPCDPHAPRH